MPGSKTSSEFYPYIFGIMEKKMEITMVCCGYLRIIEKRIGCLRIIEKKMDSTILGLGFRVSGFRVSDLQGFES